MNNYKYLLESGDLIQIINLLKQHPYNEVEGLLIKLNQLELVNITQPNAIGFNSPQYDDNEEITEEEYE